VAVPARAYGAEARALAARVVLFDHRPGPWPRSLTLDYRVLDDLQGEVLAGKTTVTMARTVEPVVLRVPAGDLFLGEYVLEVSLGGVDARWRVERSFEVTESGPPRGRDYARIMEVLSYIAEPGEVAHLRSLAPAAQAAGWEEFWHRRDPNPETGINEARVEFFRRVRYTERHFQGYGPGWRSDMGRIYIKYGPPDQVESVAYQGDMPGIEVWTYNRPLRRFLFEDRDGFGRYVLVSPAFE
jgi:GWxTD domain-containing protein